MYVVHAEPVAELPGRVILPEGRDSVVGRLFRPIVAAWLRSVERQTEAAARQFDHAGLLGEHRASLRH
jgi:hypothetical protein